MKSGQPTHQILSWGREPQKQNCRLRSIRDQRQALFQDGKPLDNLPDWLTHPASVRELWALESLPYCKYTNSTRHCHTTKKWFLAMVANWKEICLLGSSYHQIFEENSLIMTNQETSGCANQPNLILLLHIAIGKPRKKLKLYVFDSRFNLVSNSLLIKPSFWGNKDFKTITKIN